MQVQRAQPPQMIQPSTPGHVHSPVGGQMWAPPGTAIGPGTAGGYVMSPPPSQMMQQQQQQGASQQQVCVWVGKSICVYTFSNSPLFPFPPSLPPSSQVYIRQHQYNQQQQYPTGQVGVPQQVHPSHPHAQYSQQMRYAAPPYNQRPHKLLPDGETMSGEPQSAVYMYRQPPRYPYSSQTSPVPTSPHGQVGGKDGLKL